MLGMAFNLQVVLFESNTVFSLEERVNNWLEEGVGKKVIDMKYNGYSVLIIYEQSQEVG